MIFFFDLQGDSGGPLMCKYGSRKWILMGIASRVSPGNFNIYTGAATYCQWISDNINCNGGPGPF